MKMQHTPQTIARRRAFTMTELIVVLVILLLLTTMLTPVVLNRAQQARVTAAKEECKRLADAEEQCVALHGFIVPLQVLNDLPVERDVNGTRTNNLRGDIGQENLSLTFVIDPLSDLNLQALGNQLRLSDFPNSVQIVAGAEPAVGNRDLINNWAGPFVNFKKFFVSPSANAVSRIRRDYPLDPWGRPYMLVCRRGPIGGNGGYTPTSINWAMSNDPNQWDSDSSLDGSLPTSSDISNNAIWPIDRFAVMSFGPDMRTGTLNPDTVADDIICPFGGDFTARSFKAFR